MTPQEALNGALVVGIPTDTVYGLACLPDKPNAVQRIFDMKERDRDLALPVLCSDLQQAGLFGRLPDWAGRAWPGPVTLVVRRTPGSAHWNVGGPADHSVALRVPDHPVPQGLAAELGPVACTSANLHGQPTPRSAAGVLDLFGDQVAMVVDGGLLAGAASTVIDCRGTHPRVLRQGVVSLHKLTG